MMRKAWERLYDMLTKGGVREPEFVELNKIHKPDWWGEFHQYNGKNSVGLLGLRLKLFNLREVDYSTIKSLPSGSFFIVAVSKGEKVSYYINLRIATEGYWQTMLRSMNGASMLTWQNSPISYFGDTREYIDGFRGYKYYLIEKDAPFINWNNLPWDGEK